MRVLLISALGLAACSFNFDPEGDTDRFSCTEDADCLEGFVCGGHVLLGRLVESYCVESAEARLGYHLTVQSPFPDNGCTPFSSGATAELGIGVSNTTTALDPTAFGRSQNPTEAAGFMCTGTPGDRGDGNFLCTVPRGDIRRAAMWIYYVKNGGDLAFIFDEAEVVPDTVLIRPDASIGHFDLDVVESGYPISSGSGESSERCNGRAMARVAECGASASCSCSTDVTCPRRYFCAGNNQCFQRNELQVGEDCTLTADKACASESCSTNNVCE